jgi:hypothetical protein
LMLLVFLSGAGLLFAQYVHDAAPEPKFSELSQPGRERLDQQRALVAAVAKQRYGTAALTQVKARPADLTEVDR